MFYCDDCAEKAGWPTDFYIPRSRGPCEICHIVGICYDTPAGWLPKAKVPMHEHPLPEASVPLTDWEERQARELTIRRDERERCARVAEEMAARLQRIVLDEMVAGRNASDLTLKMRACRDVLLELSDTLTHLPDKDKPNG